MTPNLMIAVQQPNAPKPSPKEFGASAAKGEGFGKLLDEASRAGKGKFAQADDAKTARTDRKQATDDRSLSTHDEPMAEDRDVPIEEPDQAARNEPVEAELSGKEEEAEDDSLIAALMQLAGIADDARKVRSVSPQSEGAAPPEDIADAAPENAGEDRPSPKDERPIAASGSAISTVNGTTGAEATAQSATRSPPPAAIGTSTAANPRPVTGSTIEHEPPGRGYVERTADQGTPTPRAPLADRSEPAPARSMLPANDGFAGNGGLGDKANKGDGRDNGERMLPQPPSARGLAAPDTPDGKVGVVSFQTTPAAAASPTTLAMVSSLSAEAEPSLLARHAAEIGQQASARPALLQTLKIQLQPAELGLVTARFTAQGAEMSLELQVETAEARNRLAGDSDAIVKALRGMGFEIDRVTIQQITVSSASTSDARSGQGFGSGDTQDGGSDGTMRERREGRRDEDANGRADRGGADRGNEPGAGVYI